MTSSRVSTLKASSSTHTISILPSFGEIQDGAEHTTNFAPPHVGPHTAPSMSELSFFPSPNVPPTPSTSHVAGQIPTPVSNMGSFMATTLATSARQYGTSWNTTGSATGSGWTALGSESALSGFAHPTGIPQKFGGGNRVVSLTPTATYEPSADSTCSLTFKHKPNIFGCITTHWASTTTVSLPCSGCHTTDVTKAVYDSVFEQLHGGSLYVSFATMVPESFLHILT